MALTSGDLYQIDICLDHHLTKMEDIRDVKVTCGSFYFVMPEVESETQIVPDPALLDKISLENEDMIVLHLSNDFIPDNGDYMIGLYHRKSLDSPWILLQSSPYEKPKSPVSLSTIAFSEDNLDLGAGNYKLIMEISMSNETNKEFVLAEFSIEKGSNVALGLILFLLLMICLMIFGVYLQRQYHNVLNETIVYPNRLLESGRIKGKSVFVITNVDNRHHIDIILDLNKYLKSHCGVTKVYFALDPETGITSHPEHDPWRWAQDVTDKLSENISDSFLLFIAATPPDMGVPVYRDLPNNMSFVAAKYLKTMSDKNRVGVVHLPYSDPETIPSLVPAHLKGNVINLPKDMNDLLCQMLEVKKRELCKCLPIPIVKPKVS